MTISVSGGKHALRVIDPADRDPAHDHVKHVRIKSELLTEFWGRPFYLGAPVGADLTSWRY